MKTLYPGEVGTLVQYIQLALKRAGCGVAVDGIFGKATCECLRQFLSYQTTCIVNDAVWQELLPYLKGYRMYEIKKGDTYWNIASRFQTSVQQLLIANPQILPEELQPGMEIVLPYSFSLVSDEVAYSSLLNTWIVEGLAMRYPFLMVGSAGQSVLGNELFYLQMGTGKRQVFYNAAFHANEWITTPVLLKFAEEYAKAYASGGSLYGMSAQILYQEFSLFLLPMVNPDGVDLVTGVLKEGKAYENAVQIARNYNDIPFPSGWKANIEGVDLNLQFPAGWQSARQIKFEQGYTTPAPRDFVGMAPLAAPESRAVYEFTRQRAFSLILAYHTQGEVIYWKYLDYNPAGAKEIATYFGEVSGYEVQETPAASGYAGYKDWFIMKYNRPGYTIEAGLGENPLSMGQFPQIYHDNRFILLGGMTELLRM